MNKDKIPNFTRKISNNTSRINLCHRHVGGFIFFHFATLRIKVKKKTEALSDTIETKIN